MCNSFIMFVTFTVCFPTRMWRFLSLLIPGVSQALGMVPNSINIKGIFKKVSVHKKKKTTGCSVYLLVSQPGILLPIMGHRGTPHSGGGSHQQTRDSQQPRHSHSSTEGIVLFWAPLPCALFGAQSELLSPHLMPGANSRYKGAKYWVNT